MNCSDNRWIRDHARNSLVILRESVRPIYFISVIMLRNGERKNKITFFFEDHRILFAVWILLLGNTCLSLLISFIWRKSSHIIEGITPAWLPRGNPSLPASEYGGGCFWTFSYGHRRTQDDNRDSSTVWGYKRGWLLGKNNPTQWWRLILQREPAALPHSAVRLLQGTKRPWSVTCV